MNTYILILTLFIAENGYNSTNPATSAVTVQTEQFATRNSCLVAANAWIKQMNSINNSKLKARALCVPKQ